MQISANITYINECIESLDFSNVNSANNVKILNTIKRFLNREFGSISECEEIRIINNTSEKLFGMTVSPTMKNINNIVKDITSGRVNDKNFRPRVTKYIIEMDSKLGLLSLNLSSEEITAILMHEIGHIILNSKFVENMNMIYMEEYTKSGAIIPNQNTALTDLPAMLFVYNYITKHQLINEIKNLALERDADKFVIDLGLGKDLFSALGKFAHYYSISSNVITQNSNKIKSLDAEDAAMFIEYSKSFKNRQAFIKDIIGKEAKTLNSVFFKDFLNYIIDKFVSAKTFFMKNREKKNLSENLITRLLGITPSVTKKDIDEITIEIEMAETYEDKMYLMRKIHSKIDDIDQVLEMSSKNLTSDNKRKISILTGYKAQLQKLLNIILKKQIAEKEYQVFVKVPKKYEG